MKINTLKKESKRKYVGFYVVIFSFLMGLLSAGCQGVTYHITAERDVNIERSPVEISKPIEFETARGR